MILAKAIGTARATVKHSSMDGWKLLIAQPLMADGQTPDGDPLLAVDGTGARTGDIIILTSDGRGTRELLQADNSPVRWMVMGIQD